MKQEYNPTLYERFVIIFSLIGAFAGIYWLCAWMLYFSLDVVSAFASSRKELISATAKDILINAFSVGVIGHYSLILVGISSKSIAYGMYAMLIMTYHAVLITFIQQEAQSSFITLLYGSAGFIEFYLIGKIGLAITTWRKDIFTPRA